MDGLLLVGATHPRATPLLDEAGRGSPLTAAAHAGERLDPDALVRRARESGGDGDGVLSVPGGLLSPLTPRYAIRDLAHELGLPIVIGINAADDLVARARAELLVAHGSALAVAAVALTGWPDPPDRVRIDERTLLSELAGVPVVTDRDTWELDAWRGGARPKGVAVVLEPYTAWEPPAHTVPDPRAAGRPALMSALLDIVGAEGPVQANRAYGLYNRASGGKKLTTVARAPLSGAAYWLQKERRLLVGEDDVLRLPDTPAVRVRELGDRTLEEVPTDELTELMRRLDIEEVEALKRAVLETYGLRRLTAKTDELLSQAAALR